MVRDVNPSKYDHRSKRFQRVSFPIDWGAYEACRNGNHPAFEWEHWEPWEIVGLLKVVSARLYNDPGAQQFYLTEINNALNG